MRTKPQRTFSEPDKAAWRAAKQQRLTKLGEQLKKEVARVQDSEAFKRYLATQAVFHRYSARNVFLILFQRPAATRVAGYTTWQKLGRQVRRGESGITIFAPAPFKQATTDTTTGEVTEERIPRFKTATVFDTSTTDGQPLPTITLGAITGSAPAGAYAVLVDFATSIGYTIRTKGGQTTLERYGKEYMKELASRGGKAKRHKEDPQPRNLMHWDGTPERHVPYRPRGSLIASPMSAGKPSLRTMAAAIL